MKTTTFLLIFLGLTACGDDPPTGSPDGAPDAALDGAVDAPAVDANNPDAPPASSVGVVRNTEAYSVRVTADVEYGRGLRRRSWDDEMSRAIPLELDIYEPEGAPSTPRPAVVVIHGGGFVMGSRTQRQIVEFAQYFASRGWVAFAPTYRIAGDHGLLPDSWEVPEDASFSADQYRALYPAGRDVKAALRWIHAHAADYGISEDHITVIGGSAGSFLAVMLGVTDAADYRDEVPAAQDSTLETTNLSARSDVHTVIDHWGGPGMIEAIEAISPGDRWDATDAPISIIHGRSDEAVPFSNAEAIVAHADRVGLPYTFRPFDGGHGEWGLEVDGQNLRALAFDFVVEHQSLVVE